MPQYYNPLGYESYDAQLVKKQEIKKQKKEIRIISLMMGSAIVSYILIQKIALELLLMFDLYDLYLESSVFQNAFLIVGVSVMSVAFPFGIMALCSRKRYEHPVIPNERIKPLRCIAWVCFGMISCIGANFFVNALIMLLESLFKIEFTQGEMLDPDSPFACVMTVLAGAVVPAICEEFAMRCCSVQLLRKYGKGFAVFAVSIVFGLLHGNVIQFLFAFLIGLVMGFATVKTDSIVPALLIHMLNNSMSALGSAVKYQFGSRSSDVFTLVCFGFWFAAGIFGFVYLIVKKEFKPMPNPEADLLTNTQKFVSFLFPWMIVPFAILIWLTSKTIIK